MKLLVATLFISSAAFAQRGARPMSATPFRSPTSAPALGGSYASPVISRPLGGISLPKPVVNRNRVNRSYGGYGYGGYGYSGPIYYVPNAFDTSSYDYSNSPYGSQSAIQPPPVIIHQYFDSPRSSPPTDVAPPVVEDATIKPGDLLSDPRNYYLISYKDHTIYSALTYWLEGDTLHYVTTQNTHNQATLSLIDLDKTYKLNEDRSVPFSIPGR